MGWVYYEVSFSAVASISLNAVTNSRIELISCTIICRTGDSKHSFTILIKIKEDHLGFVRPSCSAWGIMGQLFVRQIIGQNGLYLFVIAKS